MSSRYIWLIPIDWLCFWWLIQAALILASVNVLRHMWPNPAGMLLPLLILIWQASKVLRWLLRRVRWQ
jgi:hypothetical protein